MREAHFRGHLDLREARPLDRGWWRRAGWTLDWLEDQLAGKAWQLKFQLHTSLLSYELESETFQLHWDKAQEAQQHLRRLWLPWLEETATPTAVQGLKERWQEVWGDPGDPAVAERIRSTAAALLARNRAGK